MTNLVLKCNIRIVILELILILFRKIQCLDFFTPKPNYFHSTHISKLEIKINRLHFTICTRYIENQRRAIHFAATTTLATNVEQPSSVTFCIIYCNLMTHNPEARGSNSGSLSHSTMLFVKQIMRCQSRIWEHSSST